jgi:type I restriction enzyme S subunit
MMSKLSFETYMIRDIARINVGRDLNEKSFSKKETSIYKFPVYSNSVENRGLYGFYDFEEFPGNSLTTVGRGIGLGTSFARDNGFGAIGRLIVLSPINNSFDIHYLAEFINNKLRIFNESGGIPQLPGEAIGKYKVILPPLPEQKAIAGVLSVWDEGIEKITKLIALKEKKFKWLLKTLISDQCSMNNENPGWKKVKLGEVCEIKKGQQLNVVHMTDNGLYYALNGGISASGRTDDWNTEAETISISEGGNSCGYVNFNTEKFWSGGHCYCLMNLKDVVDKQFLYFFLKNGQLRIMTLRVGSGLPNIQKKDLCRFKVEFPSLEVQQQIASTLNTAQKEIDLLKKIAEKYKEQKKGLMQKLLTGEWRVGA